MTGLDWIIVGLVVLAASSLTCVLTAVLIAAGQPMPPPEE